MNYEEKAMSDLRFLFRYVYSQQHELSDRSHWVWDFSGNGTIPAVYSERIKLAKHAGMQIMELVEKEYPTKRYYDRRMRF